MEVKNEFEYPKTVTIHPLKLLSATSLSIIVGLQAESEKRGVGSPIEIKLCRLEKSAEGSKVYAINNDDNEDEMTFLRAIATRSGSKGKSNDFPFEYYTPSALVIISLPPPTFHCMFT